MTVRVAYGSIARVAIDAPRTRNALSTAIISGAAEAIRSLSQSSGIRVIVLTGEGGTFSSGVDLKENAPVESVTAAVIALFEAIAESPIPVLARVEGHCLGLAVGVMAACDLAIAATETSFGLPEPRMGQAPTLAALTIVPRLRASDANELLLTGAMFDGARACQLGLVNESVPARELDDAVERWTELVRAGGPAAIAACKRLVRGVRTLAAPEALALATDLARRIPEGTEAEEGLAAFRERRVPDWATPAGEDTRPT